MIHLGRNKRYHILPPSHQPSHSLKASHNHYSYLTKRHSLDSKPQKNSLLDNVEEPTKHSSSKPRIGKSKDITIRSKYYWRGKSYRSGKKDEKSKGKKVKRTWSQFGKQLGKKHKNKNASRIKFDDSAQINISDRLDTKEEATNGKSSQSFIGKKEYFSGYRIRAAKSLLNSTMLTKRESEESKPKKKMQYEEVIFKLKDILDKYEKKVRQLKKDREFYKSKLRKQKKKRLQFCF